MLSLHVKNPELRGISEVAVDLRATVRTLKDDVININCVSMIVDGTNRRPEVDGYP